MLFPLSDKDIIYSKITILYFYNENTLFHYKYLLQLNEINEKYKKYNFYAINIDYYNNIVKNFKIENVPCVVLVKNNKLIKNINLLNINNLLIYFDDILFKYEGVTNDK